MPLYSIEDIQDKKVIILTDIKNVIYEVQEFESQIFSTTTQLNAQLIRTKLDEVRSLVGLLNA